MAVSAVVLIVLSAIILCRAQTNYTVPELEIYQMHIRSDITFRFATTLVSARLKNRAQEAREVEFSVTLPESAFISNFSMTIDGEWFYGKVKPKKVAKKEYTEAKKRGESAGKISQESLDSSVFTVSVNVAAQAKVNFNLTYQELLIRRLGLYEHLVNINPGQVVPDLRLDIFIRESHAITELRVPPMRQIINRFQLTQPGENPLAAIESLSSTDVHVSYVPSVADQMEHGNNGLNQQFILQYDVARESSTGELQVVNGYFVHYFAPVGLDPVNKDVCFVIDVSGSMSGSKIQQTKEAMNTILDDLRPGDRFTIVQFSSSSDVWPMRDVNAKSIRQAKRFVDRLNAGGGTNINSALEEGIELMISRLSEDTSRPALIVFLTDGDPTSGVTHKPTIASNLRNANLGRVSVFSLGFGQSLDFNFLRKLSLQNRGFARKIYEGVTATVQLEGFYDEISSPVMANVKFNYLGDAVDQESITNTDLGTLFDGSEFVVAGRLNNDVTSVPYNIFGGSAQGNLSLNMEIQTTDAEQRARELNLEQFTERLWAYLTIRRILDKMVATEDMAEKEQLEQQATEMSLKYGFVTPLTSMVVTKPREPRSNISNKRRTKPNRRPEGTEADTEDAPQGSFVENDPHFVIKVDGLGEGLCFDISDHPGTVYQLVYDKVTAITVNALIVAPPGVRYRTYLGEIRLQHRGHNVRVTPSEIVVKNRSYKWSDYRVTDGKDVLVTIADKKYVDVTYFGNVTFRILRHMFKTPTPRKVDFLGFYIKNGAGLSRWTHGLVGQFQHQRASMVTSPHLDIASGHFSSNIRLTGPNSGKRVVSAHLGRRRNMDEDAHVDCWHVRNNGAGMLEGHHWDYIVPDLQHNGYTLGIATLKELRKNKMEMISGLFKDPRGPMDDGSVLDSPWQDTDDDVPDTVVGSKDINDMWKFID